MTDAEKIAELTAKIAQLEAAGKRYEAFKDMKDEDLQGLLPNYNELSKAARASLNLVSKKATPEQRAAALRYLLSESEEFTKEEIESQVRDLLSPEFSQETDPQSTPARGKKEQMNTESEEQKLIKELSAKVKSMEDHQVTDNYTRLNNQLKGLVEQSLQEETLKGFVEKAKDKDKARAYITASIEKRAKDLLSAKSREAGTFDERWMVDAVKMATKNESEGFRSVIGDPNLIGRAPETDSGTEEFLKQKPVEAPSLVVGEKPSQEKKAQMDAHIKDTLTRAFMEATAGEASKV